MTQTEQSSRSVSLDGGRILLIRADAGPEIGFGHAMRCAALAQIAKSAGWCTVWASRGDVPSSLAPLFDQRIPLPGTADFSPPPTSEIRIIKAQLHQPPNVVLLDHYGIELEYLESCSAEWEQCLRVLIDDHQRRRGADCRWAPYDNAGVSESHNLIGPTFLPLRQSLISARKPRLERSRGFLVAFGGIDAPSLTMRAIDYLSAVYKDEPIVVLASDEMAARQGIDKRLTGLSTPSVRYAWLDDIPLAQLFSEVRKVICSASGIAVEAVACSAPTIAVEWTENQKCVAAALKRWGVQVRRDLNDLPSLIDLAGPRPLHYIDGHGARRVWESVQRLGAKNKSCA